MTSIEERITHMLADAGERIHVSRDVASVTAGAAVIVRPSRAEPPRRRALVVAVASLAALLVGGLMFVTNSKDSYQPEPSASSPASPTDLYPVVDSPPAWAFGMYGSYRVPGDPAPPQAMYALLARSDGGDDVVDPIFIVVHPRTSIDEEAAGTPIGVGSGTGRLLSGPDGDAGSRTVSFGDEAIVSVSGEVETSLLVAVAESVVLDSAAGIEFSLGTIPSTYAVVVHPIVQPTPVLSAAASSLDGALDVSVDNNLPDPRLRTALFGNAIAIQVGEVTGWYSQGPTASDFTVAWEVQSGEIVVISATHPGLTAQDVVEIAQNTRLTSESEWRTIYNVEKNPLPEPQAPVIGEPLPYDECNTPYVTVAATSCD